MLNKRDKRKIEKLIDNCQYSEVIKSGRQAIKKETDLDWYYFLTLALDQRAVLQRNVAGRKKDQHEALLILRQAIKIFPDDPRLIHVRGLIRLHRGENKKALKDFQTAYQLSKKFEIFGFRGQCPETVRSN